MNHTDYGAENELRDIIEELSKGKMSVGSLGKRL